MHFLLFFLVLYSLLNLKSFSRYFSLAFFFVLLSITFFLYGAVYRPQFFLSFLSFRCLLFSTILSRSSAFLSSYISNSHSLSTESISTNSVLLLPSFNFPMSSSCLHLSCSLYSFSHFLFLSPLLFP